MTRKPTKPLWDAPTEEMTAWLKSILTPETPIEIETAANGLPAEVEINGIKIVIEEATPDQQLIWDADHQNYRQLVALLESDREISPDVRRWIAMAIRTRHFARRPQRTDHNLLALADSDAEVIKEIWRKEYGAIRHRHDRETALSFSAKIHGITVAELESFRRKSRAKARRKLA